MRRFLNWRVYLLIIVLIAAFLRFYQLGSNPPSLTWDEAAWGYNAYSLGIDGKDEFGRFLPFNYLESFGDFKPTLYAYLDIIPIKIFGLTEFATRFPSALFGVLTVLMTFFLVKRIFYTSKQKENYALMSSLILAISPWHIMLSRGAFEANVASFFIISGVWAFLAGVQAPAVSESRTEKKWYLIISAISFALSMYIFNTSRIVSPLLVLLLIVVFRKKLWEFKKQTLIAFIIGFLIFIPIFGFLLTPQASLRFKEVNIFSNKEVIETSNQQIENDGNVLWSKVIHNRRLLYSVEYIKHYFDNLSPNFLFIKGDGNPKFSIQSVGQMYIWDIIFFVGGILFLIRKREGNWWLVPLWLLIGILPAATARETPHALRIETTLPTFQIFVAYGFVVLMDKITKYKKFIVYGLLFILFLNFLYFYRNYFNHYPYEYSGEWQYGYKQSIEYVKSVEKSYDYIQVTNALGRPYIYYLFYTKTDPKYFRKNAKVERDAFGFVAVRGFGKYLFPDEYSYSLSKENKVLYINSYYNVPKNATVVKTFYLLNGERILVAYTI